MLKAWDQDILEGRRKRKDLEARVFETETQLYDVLAKLTEAEEV
jgi:hypothetical protein